MGYGNKLWTATLNPNFGQTANIVDSYVEVVGRVMDATTVQMLVCINLGDDLGEISSAPQYTDSLMSFSNPYGRHETCE